MRVIASFFCLLMLLAPPALAHMTEVPHVHPHPVGLDMTNAIILTGMFVSVLAILGAAFFVPNRRRK